MKESPSMMTSVILRATHSCVHLRNACSSTIRGECATVAQAKAWISWPCSLRRIPPILAVPLAWSKDPSMFNFWIEGGGGVQFSGAVVWCFDPEGTYEPCSIHARSGEVS